VFNRYDFELQVHAGLVPDLVSIEKQPLHQRTADGAGSKDPYVYLHGRLKWSALGSGSSVIGIPLFDEIRDTDLNQKDPHRCRADLDVSSGGC
jgi:hypothetical protein